MWLKVCILSSSPQIAKGRSRTMWPRLTWGTADLLDINSMVLNKLRLVERQRTKNLKNVFHFLLLTTTCFITRHQRADGSTEGQKARSGPFWRRNYLYNSRSETFEAFSFAGLTEAGGMYKIPEHRALNPAAAL